MSRGIRLALPIVALLAACEHTAPLTPGDYGPDGPKAPGSPLRLTYNLGDDRGPTWLPDGSGILYTAERFDRPDFDHCLAVLPRGGGAIVRQRCHNTGPSLDSVDVLLGAALRADGAVAMVLQSGHLLPARGLPFDRQAIVLAAGGVDAPLRVLRTIPYIAPTDTFHRAVQSLRWLDDSTLIYVGSGVAYPGSRDTLIWGLEVATIDVGATPTVQVIPGTRYASSVAVGATPDTIYYTVSGDSRVFRRALAGGQTDTVFDFGAIVRDVVVRGGRLFAVVGGDVTYRVDTVLGPVQDDNGGALQVLDVQSSVVTTLLAGPARHPAVAPDGSAVVAAVRDGSRHDLWLVPLP